MGTTTPTVQVAAAAQSDMPDPTVGARQPPSTILEHPRVGALLALVVAVLPAGAGVAVANLVAGHLDPVVGRLLHPLVGAVARVIG